MCLSHAETNDKTLGVLLRHYKSSTNGLQTHSKPTHIHTSTVTANDLRNNAPLLPHLS
jgi:hypothetical protein